MKILKESRVKGSKIIIEVELSKEELKKFINQAVGKISQEVKIEGFRPGKAPRFLLEQKVGQDKILSEALDLALVDSYYEAVAQKAILPLARPEIKLLEFDENRGLKYEATIEVLPEVSLGDWKSLIRNSKIKKQENPVKEEQIEETLKALQKRLIEFEPKEGAVKKGDRVEVNFESFIAGVPVEGGVGKNQPLIIGDNLMVPGFEEQIIGMEKGEKKTFSLVFPADFHNQELASKKVDFKVELLDVKKVKLPEINDELAKKFGQKNIAALRKAIEDDLKKQEERKAEEKYISDLLDYLVSKIEIDVPEILVKEEVESIINRFKGQILNLGLNFEDYIKKLGKTEDEIKRESTPQAVKQVKVALILNKIAAEEKIEISEKEIEQEIQNLSQQYPEAEEAQAQLSREANRKYLRNVILNRKVISLIKNLAS